MQQKLRRLRRVQISVMIVQMPIYQTRRNEQAGGVDDARLRPAARLRQIADCRDPTADDSDIGAEDFVGVDAHHLPAGDDGIRRFASQCYLDKTSTFHFSLPLMAVGIPRQTSFERVLTSSSADLMRGSRESPQRAAAEASNSPNRIDRHVRKPLRLIAKYP